jgi:hypothetical protein
MVEVVRTCETSIYFYKNTRLYLPKSCHLHTHRLENLMYYINYVYTRGWNFVTA